MTANHAHNHLQVQKIKIFLKKEESQFETPLKFRISVVRQTDSSLICTQSVFREVSMCTTTGRLDLSCGASALLRLKREVLFPRPLSASPTRPMFVLAHRATAVWQGQPLVSSHRACSQLKLLGRGPVSARCSECERARGSERRRCGWERQVASSVSWGI